ncbi:MAG: glycosyltransferase family 2 protein [Bacteroidota bacterium]
MSQPQINIVVPLYNEEAVFEKLIQRLQKLMDSMSQSIEVILIDDGSKDQTGMLMRLISLQDPRFQSIFLSRNHGHQLALTAGLSVVNATEAVMVIDGDLQDPPELLTDFYEKLKEGYEVIYAVRKNRKESLPKRMAYKLYYRIQRKLSNVEIPLDSGDFCMMSRRAVDVLNQMPEQSRFIRGMRAWIGFNQIGIEYDRSAREEGESKYSFKQLLSLAFNGIFNFSEFPIRFITRLGIGTVTISLLYLIHTLFKRFVLNEVPEGFTALLLTIVMFSGVQLISLGLIGEYVLRIFFQIKGRPLFIIKEHIRQQETVKEEVKTLP